MQIARVTGRITCRRLPPRAFKGLGMYRRYAAETVTKRVIGSSVATASNVADRRRNSDDETRRSGNQVNPHGHADDLQ